MITPAFTDIITRLERMPSSRNGNPRFRVSFAEHDSLPTEVDGSVEVTLNQRGNAIAYLRVAKK